jgi:hypothetical protein
MLGSIWKLLRMTLHLAHTAGSAAQLLRRVVPQIRWHGVVCDLVRPAGVLVLHRFSWPAVGATRSSRFAGKG